MSALSRLFFDPVDSDRTRAAQRYQFGGDSRWWLFPLTGGAVALGLAVVLGVAGGMDRFLFAYLTGWAFAVSISIGALFFVMIQHITKARWSTTIRRIPEMLAANFPLLALLGLPILIGYHDLYHWSHAELYDPAGEFDSILAGKAGYFFFPMEAGGFPVFWMLRYVAFFAFWSFLAAKLYGYSVRNDTEPSAENTRELRKWSAIGIPLTAVTVSFFAYDAIMSLDPHWFSTMWGVYFFAGGWLGALCLITFIALLYKRAGMLEEVTREHLHDMGKFVFAFVVFWTYIAFSQYMLYWYGNLPEETVWFHKRAAGGWGIVGQALVVFHFLLPFLILLPRASKRIYPVLAVMCVWLLTMHWVDLWWQVMPSMLPHGAEHADPEAHAALRATPDDAVELVLTAAQGAPSVSETVPDVVQGTETPAPEMTTWVVPARLGAVDLLCGLGFFLLLIGGTFLRSSRHALTPYNDPYFAESIRFENV